MNSPMIQTPGEVPYLGSKLKVDRRSFFALMASIIVCDSLASVLGLMVIWKDSESESGQFMELRDEDTERGREDEHR